MWATCLPSASEKKCEKKILEARGGIEPPIMVLQTMSTIVISFVYAGFSRFLSEEGSSVWFTYGNGSATPGLVAYIGGGSAPGAQDSEGKRILPIPVKLVKNANFNQFQNLIRAQVRADARAEKTDPNEYIFHRVTATFVGRIDGVSPDFHAFHLKRTEMDRADFLGFGQMGLSDAQFALQSVESDAVLSASSPIPRAQ